jgi:hypothetical protein
MGAYFATMEGPEIGLVAVLPIVPQFVNHLIRALVKK